MQTGMELQPRQVGLSVAETQSLTPCEIVLAKELHLTRLNAKAEPDSALDSEFFRAFVGEPPEAVEWAFREWRNISPFWPAISDIRERIVRWKRDRQDEAEAKQRAVDAQESERARREGKLISWEQVVRDAGLPTAPKRYPETGVDPTARRTELQEQARNICTQSDGAKIPSA
jgi:hypothetical protein